MTIIQLHGNWQFREADSDHWYSADVPGCVHTDLFRNRFIKDPFYRDVDQHIQWIGE